MGGWRREMRDSPNLWHCERCVRTVMVGEGSDEAKNKMIGGPEIGRSEVMETCSDGQVTREFVAILG